MGMPPADFWNGRFSQEAHAYGERASRLLTGYRDHLPATGLAFVPGAGQGRDAVFLATCGLQVQAADFSKQGLARAQSLAEKAGVEIEPLHLDLIEWDWPTDAFDVIAANFFHFPSEIRRALHQNMLEALKPGGVLFLECFSRDQLAYQETQQSGGPPEADMLPTRADIEADFCSATPIALWSGVEHLNEGPYHTGLAALIRAIYTKPKTEA